MKTRAFSAAALLLVFALAACTATRGGDTTKPVTSGGPAKAEAGHTLLFMIKGNNLVTGSRYPQKQTVTVDLKADPNGKKGLATIVVANETSAQCTLTFTNADLKHEFDETFNPGNSVPTLEWMGPGTYTIKLNGKPTDFTATVVAG